MSGGGARHLAPLDGLRALACLVVVASHLQTYGLIDLDPGGSFGVMLFFSLSGFLMGYLYLEQPFGALRVLDYVIARFARIAPLYLTVIVASWVVHRYVWSGFVYAITDGNLARHLLFLGDVSVFWSIPPEVQFYGVFIALWGCWSALRRGGNPTPLLLAAVGLALAVLFGQATPGTFVASKISFFATGLLAAVARRHCALDRMDRRALAAAQAVALALYIACLFPAWRQSVFSGAIERYADLRLALLTGALTWLFAYETPFARIVLGNRVAVAIGAWSFSLYLLHNPVLQLSGLWLRPAIGGTAAGIAGVAGAIGASFVSYRLLEAPLRAFTKNGLTALLHSRQNLAPTLDLVPGRPLPRRQDTAG
jgi:peptidoglycan/LPS O-acetylase OafA/YrhL